MTHHTRVLNRANMLAFLGEIAGKHAGEGQTCYLPPHLPPDEISAALKGLPLPAEAAAAIAGARHGAVVFYLPPVTHVVLPPFPVPAHTAAPACYPGPLLSLLEPDYRIALVLIRLGSYAVGLSQGEKLVGSKVGTGLVHARHKKGGSSQHRFARHRDKQIETFLTRICQHAREQLEPHLSSLDYVVYGGARTTIQLLQKQCPFLGKITAPELPPLLDIPEPRQAVLTDSLAHLWASTVMEWREG